MPSIAIWSIELEPDLRGHCVVSDRFQHPNDRFEDGALQKPTIVTNGRIGPNYAVASLLRFEESVVAPEAWTMPLSGRNHLNDVVL